MNRYFTTQGIVVNKKNSKESDLLIGLLTPRLGKISAIAKGSRNIRSRRLGHLQLGNIIKAHLYSKNSTYWLMESTSVVSFLKTRKNLAQVNLLFYFLELINLVVAPDQQIEGVYQLSQNIISAINLNRVADYLQNEIDLISLLGFGLPRDIRQYFEIRDYRRCQQLIQRFIESIIEHPLESQKLFR